MTDKNLFLDPPETILEIAGKLEDAVWAVIGSNSLGSQKLEAASIKLP